MKRNALFAAAFVAAALLGLSQAVAVQLVSETEANRHGLTRAWFAQVEMDAGRSRIRNVVLDNGALFVQTDRAMINAFNAETGRTLWAKMVGRPEHPSLTPGVNADLLAVLNGSRLYAVNRYNGNVLFDIEVNGAPGAGAALSSKRAYIPMINGMVMAYRLEPMTDPLKELNKLLPNATPEEKAAAEEARRENIRLRREVSPPLSCRSDGRVLVPPLLVREDKDTEVCAWPTDRGFLTIALVEWSIDEHFVVKYRMEAKAGVDARPAYLPPDPKVVGDSGLVVAGGGDGFVYAVADKTGEVAWRHSTGEPIIVSPVIVGDRVFVCNQRGGMYCLEAKTGKELWWAANILRFVAAGKQRVYALDKVNRLVALNAQNGQQISAVAAGDFSLTLVNNQTDRIYLIDPRGLVQCLHEIELREPLQYNQPPAAEAGDDPDAPKRPGPQPKGGEQPGAEPEKPAEPATPAPPPGELPADPFK